jgi:hypothetical protein
MNKNYNLSIGKTHAFQDLSNRMHIASDIDTKVSMINSSQED